MRGKPKKPRCVDTLGAGSGSGSGSGLDSGGVSTVEDSGTEPPRSKTHSVDFNYTELIEACTELIELARLCV